jgi:two-component SAPR family response regulator
MVVDVDLPEMSGPALVEEVRRTLPGVGVPYVSAYDVEAVRSHGVDPDTVLSSRSPSSPTTCSTR